VHLGGGSSEKKHRVVSRIPIRSPHGPWVRLPSKGKEPLGPRPQPEGGNRSC